MKGGVWRFTSVVKRKEERNSSQNPFKESKRVGLKMSSAETTLESTLTEPYSKGEGSPVALSVQRGQGRSQEVVCAAQELP